MFKKAGILKLTLLCIILLLMFCFYGTSEAGNEGKIGLNVNYPGIGVKYGLSPKFSIELKAQTGDNIFAAGLRAYVYMGENSKTILFWGGEVDYITFEGTSSKGTGYAVGAFTGGETYVTDTIGLQLDLGAMNIDLTDESTDVNISGIELVVNIGINLYFGGGN